MGKIMHNRRSVLKYAGAGLLLTSGVGSAGTSYADEMPGVTDAEIRIGNIAPYSGPVSALSSLAKTIAAYFDKVNAEGGINGRKIKFISYDDGYSPPKTVEQARRLVESDKVLLIFHSIGTAQNAAIERYMNSKKVPQLFIASGANVFADPERFPWTMGWLPNYQSEGTIYGRWIAAQMPGAKIGVLYQNDYFGKDLQKGLKSGLGDKASAVVAEASYEVTDPTIDSQVTNLKASGADVFINIATPRFAAQAIRKAYEIGWGATQIVPFIANSVGAVLKPAGLEASKGLISSGFQKDMQDPQWANDPARKDWEAFMDAFLPGGDKSSNHTTYGYTAAQAMVHVLKAAGDDLSRKNVMKQAASMKDVVFPLFLPGVAVNTSEADYKPIEQLQLMRFDGERWKGFGKVISGEVAG